MHDPRFEEPLTDAALDREIEQLLAVNPGPGFVTRVRARIAHDERTSHRPWSFRALAIAATVAVIVVSAWYVGRAPVGLVPRSGPAGDVGRVPRSGPAGNPYVGRVPRSGPALDLPGGPPDPTSPFVPVTSEELRLPPVLIAEDERRALAAVGLREPEPERADANVGGDRIADLPALTEIAVAGVDIRPLTQIAMFEGDRQ